MARTAQADSPTKNKLLGAAQDLMLEQGFAATTVENICDCAGVTKGSFFHYFESKDDLGQQLLQRFCVSGQQKHASLCCQESDPLKRVYGYVDGLVAMSKDPQAARGCLLGLFSQELSDVNPKIQKACCRGFDAWTEHFSQEVAKAKAKYAPRAAFRPREVAQHLIAVLEGSLILAKARQDMRIVGQNLSHYKAYLKSLFEKA